MVSTWKVILATMVIFTAGMLTGGVMIHQFAKRPSPPAPFQPMILRKEFLGRMNRELALTRQQRERIEKIMTESQERTRLLWELVGPEMRDEVMHVREDIREELRPEQLTKFEELMKQRPRKPMETDPRRLRNSKGPSPSGQSNFQAVPAQDRR